MSKSKAKQVDQARATIRSATLTDAEMASVARNVTTSAKAAPGWATAPDLQAATTAWTKAADALDANASKIAQLKSQTATLDAQQMGVRRAWRTAKRQVLGAADALCAGSADDLKANGFDVLTRVAPGTPIAPPDSVTVKPGKAIGQVAASWPKGSARHGFVVQHGTDVANPATYATPVPCTATKFTLSGAQTGSNVSFRVAAVDPSSPTNQTAWSAWAVGVAH